MTPDYTTLMDEETWAFIRRINAFYPPDAAELPITQNRAIYDRMSRAFHAGRPAGVDVTDDAVDCRDRAVPIRTYRREDPDRSALVLYLHGGGYVLGGLDSHDDICADLCAMTGISVLSADYRLAPEHGGTAALDDAVCVYRWMAANSSTPIVLVGESAGGNLAACLAHTLPGDAPMPSGQVLIYPDLGGDGAGSSYRVHAEAPLLSLRDVEYYRRVRCGGADCPADPRFAPLAGDEFSGLPPTVVFTAECDPLSSDGDIYCARIRDSGGKALWREEAGLPHGYLRARRSASRARDSFARIVSAVQMLARGEWPAEGR